MRKTSIAAAFLLTTAFFGVLYWLFASPEQPLIASPAKSEDATETEEIVHLSASSQSLQNPEDSLIPTRNAIPRVELPAVDHTPETATEQQNSVAEGMLVTPIPVRPGSASYWVNVRSARDLLGHPDLNPEMRALELSEFQEFSRLVDEAHKEIATLDSLFYGKARELAHELAEQGKTGPRGRSEVGETTMSVKVNGEKVRVTICPSDSAEYGVLFEAREQTREDWLATLREFLTERDSPNQEEEGS